MNKAKKAWNLWSDFCREPLLTDTELTIKAKEIGKKLTELLYQMQLTSLDEKSNSVTQNLEAEDEN